MKCQVKSKFSLRHILAWLTEVGLARQTDTADAACPAKLCRIGVANKAVSNSIRADSCQIKLPRLNCSIGNQQLCNFLVSMFDGAMKRSAAILAYRIDIRSFGDQQFGNLPVTLN